MGRLVSVVGAHKYRNVVYVLCKPASPTPQMLASASASLDHYTGKASELSCIAGGGGVVCRLLSLNQLWEGSPTDHYLGQAFGRFFLELTLLQWLMAKVSCLIHL